MALWLLYGAVLHQTPGLGGVPAAPEQMGSGGHWAARRVETPAGEDDAWPCLAAEPAVRSQA